AFLIALAPLADRVEVLEREPRRIDDAVAARAGRIGTMRLDLLAQRLGLHGARLVALLERRHVWRRRNGRRVEKRAEDVLPAVHRRCSGGDRGERQDAALAEQSETIRIRQLHLAETLAVDAGNTVVLREALVEERVVGVQQLEHAVVLAQDVAEEHFRFAPEGTGGVVVELW